MIAGSPRPDVRCVLDARAGIGEGPVWSAAEGVLWWVEILEKRLHRFDPHSGEDRVFAMPSFIGCVALAGEGKLYVALQEGISFFDPASQTLRALPNTAPPEAGARFNDGAVSPGGRLLVTTMAIEPPFDRADYALYVLDRDARLKKLVSGLHIGNGLAFSADGGTLYLSDSHPSRRCIWMFDWDEASATVANRRLFFELGDLPGHPDGAAVDAEGGYWFACAYGWRIARLTSGGALDRVISVPVQKPTKPAFGGARLDTIYLTSIGTNLEAGSNHKQPHAGGVFAIDAGAIGRPAPVLDDFKSSAR